MPELEATEGRSAETNVAGFLLGNGDPLETAIYFEREQYTYSDIDRAARAIAIHLRNVGCAKGERALLIGTNSFFWVAAYLGTMRAGLVCVPLPTGIKASDLGEIVASVEPMAACVEAGPSLIHAQAYGDLHLVTDRRVEHPTARSLANLRDLQQRLDARAAWFPPVATDDLASLMFTSGTTGTPRGVMVSHGNIIANTTSIIESLRLTRADRIMTVLPFHYCYGASLLHTHLRIGGSLVVDSRFMYVETILERMIESACTGFAGVPMHFQTLLRNSTLRRRQFPSLRYVQQAGGRLTPALIDEVRATLPHASVFVMYGQTEGTARLSCLPAEMLDLRRGSIGKGLAGVRLSVLNERGQRVLPGEVGEIVAEGPNVTKGYWRAPEESRASFRDGRLYTGDLATVDADGFVYITGRAKDFVKCRGERIACQRLEDRLLECRDIVEAAIIGVPDDALGEAVKAFVVPRTPGDGGVADRLLAFCKRHMPAYLVPKEVVVLDAMPKSDAGKVRKGVLGSY